VYSILVVQLLITFGFVALFIYHEPLRLWTYRNPGAFYGAFAVTIVTMLAMACCEGVRKKFPGNFICLGVFTIAEGFLLGTAASTFK
jgi:FtsH-binding integral membrane protein